MQYTCRWGTRASGFVATSFGKWSRSSSSAPYFPNSGYLFWQFAYRDFQRSIIIWLALGLFYGRGFYTIDVVLDWTHWAQSAVIVHFFRLCCYRSILSSLRLLDWTSFEVSGLDSVWNISRVHLVYDTNVKTTHKTLGLPHLEGTRVCQPPWIHTHANS